MRLIHTGGFNRSERKQWRVVIFSNIVNAFQVIVGAMQEQDGAFDNEQNAVSATADLPLHASRN